MSSLLGRSDALRELADVLGGARLVTLSGAPGIGKSRLGIELARRVAGRYPDHAWLAELASVADPALVPQALASALSVHEVTGQGLTDTLIAHLRQGRLLVVLDNCEHVIAACAGLVDALLASCPELRVLATSREPLALAGERVWEVPPLSVPAPDEAARPDLLAGYAAVDLFVERAAAVQPCFRLNADVARPVAEICRRLDGIPLAIELAAARVEVLTPVQIAQRLDDRFTVLTKAGRNGLARHQTLEAALDWSHRLLSAPERALLRRLSVFVGDFELEAAEMVCSGGEVTGSEVFDLIARLVAKSLVVADTASSATARYRLLETIRAYAADKLDETDETARLRVAHAHFYCGLAEEAEPELTGPGQERWLARLEAEHGNLRSAVEWSLAHGRAESVLRLAGALVLFWRVRCHFGEGRELLDAAVSARDGVAPALQAKALWGAGFMAHMAGDSEGAVLPLEQSLASFRQLGDVHGCARALLVLGNCRQYRADPTALSLLEESAELAREADDPWCLAHALALAGFEHAARSELPVARALFEQCLAVARAAIDKQGLRFGLLGLGLVCARQGEYDTAESLLEETVAISDELGEDYSKATALRYLGEIALGRADYARAEELVEESLAVLPEPRPSDAAGDALVLRASLAHAEGEHGRSRRLFEEALTLAGKDGKLIAAVQGLGELAVAHGDPNAGDLLEEACDLARSIGDKGCLARALHTLGRMARDQDDAGRAAALHNEALELQREIGAAPEIAASLEAVGGLAAAGGRHQHATRLLGAASALRDKGGYARVPWESSRYEADIALVRQALSAEELEDALGQGKGLTIDQAVAQALKGRRRRGRPLSGWPSLTDTEQRVAALAAEGLTNSEIAERLFITLATVKTHLSHIFSKLGVARRRDLEREVPRR